MGQIEIDLTGANIPSVVSGMASSKRARVGLAACAVLHLPHPNSGVLQADVMYEILLRVPARELCRLRAVCRPWRAALSDPRFIAEHAAGHPEPLIVAGYPTGRREHGALFDIMDLSGRVVKRIRPTWDAKEWVTSVHRDLVCTTNGTGNFRLLNPANGVVYALPETISKEHSDEVDFCYYKAAIVFEQVPTTGVYKVLRFLKGSIVYSDQLCEVFTLDGSTHARWRGVEECPDLFDTQSRVAINGIVYFLSVEHHLDPYVAPGRIVSFDLGTEEWREALQGPILIMPDNHIDYHNISLAALNGSLVVVHCVSSSRMDLWFLKEFENSLWVKQHSIQVNLSVQLDEFFVHPLLVLTDGRIVTYIGSRGLLRIYDPRTSTYTDVAEMGPRLGIGLYTGNLLTLPNGAS